MKTVYVLVNKITGDVIETKSKIYHTILGADDARNKYINDKSCNISPENVIIRKLNQIVDLTDDDLIKLENEKKERKQASFRTQLQHVIHNKEIWVTFANRKLSFTNRGMLCKVILDDGDYKLMSCETDEVFYIASRMSKLKDILYEEFNKGVIERIDYLSYRQHLTEKEN